MSTTNTNAQSQVPARVNVDALLEEVQRRQADVLAFLPPDTSPARFWALARQAIQQQPELATCSSASVLNAIARCAASGLELDGRNSSLIIRKSKNGRPTATWSPSYAGCIWQAMASGFVRSIQAEVVHAADVFEVQLGSEPKITHRPCLTGARGDLVACYATAELSSGAKVVEILTAEDVRKIAAMSPVASAAGPWSTWPAEMWKKCAVRRITKRLPAGNTRAPMASRAHAGTRADKSSSTSTADALTPEQAFAMECTALEQLSAATTVDEIDAAWAQAQIEHQQRGAPVPLRVEAAWHEKREALSERESG